MKEAFVQPRFDGKRFADSTLPLELARDLAAYETLVVELAKHLFLQEHPSRKRVLRGFEDGFELHLERLDEGSAKPLISVVMAGVLALGGTNVYFERARDLISECISAPVGQLPAAFPRPLLKHFNQVGRSLRAGERMELPLMSGGVAILTPERRKHLVLAVEKVYEREIELDGGIAAVDWVKSTFRLLTPDETSITIPMPKHFHAQAREFGGRFRHQVRVQGTATFDELDKPYEVIAIKSLDMQPDYQLAARLEAISSLADGWHDGAGKAPDKEKVALVSEKIVGRFPEKTPLPLIVQTQEGNLLFEWDLPEAPSIDLELTEMRGYYHAFQGDLEVEKEFSLNTDEEWNELFQFLSETLPSLT